MEKQSSIRIVSFVCVGLVALLWAAPAVAADKVVSMWSDARVKSWSALLLSGRAKEALKAVEDDLRSAHPHPLATTFGVPAVRMLRWAGQAGATGPALTAAMVVDDIEVDRGAQGVRQRFSGVSPRDVPDLWTLEQLAVAATTLDRTSELLEYLDEMARRDPHNFFVAWSYIVIIEEFAGNASIRDDVLRRARLHLNAQTALPVVEFLSIHGGSPVDYLHAVDQYLRVVPDEPSAHRFRALQLEALGRLLEALDAWRRVSQLNPAGGVSAEGSALARTGAFAEARKLCEQRADLIYRMPEDRVTACLIDRFIAAGEISMARRGLKDVEDRKPQAWAARRLARLDRDVARHDASLERAEQAVELQPEWLINHEAKVGALRRSGSPGKVRPAVQAARQQAGQVSPTMLEDDIIALRTLKRHAEAIQSARDGLREFPAGEALQCELAESLWADGSKQKAMEAIHTALELRPKSSCALDKLSAWAVALGGTARARQELTAQGVRAPQVAAVWEKLRALVSTEESDPRKAALARVEIARAAQQANPQALWPLSHEIDDFAAVEMWQEVAAAQERMDRLVVGGTLGQRLTAMWQVRWTLLRQMDAGAVAKSAVTALLGSDGELCKVYPRRDCYRFRAELLSFLGRDEEALAAVQAWTAVDPENIDPIWFGIRGRIPNQNMFPLAMRWYQRNDHDRDRLSWMVHWHAKWGGSSVVSLYFADLHRKRAPGAKNAIDNSAFGALGDHVTAYLHSYQGSAAISKSERYIDWWESTRRLAQAHSTRVALSFDPQTHARCKVPGLKPNGLAEDVPFAWICEENGDVRVVADDPVTGRPLLRQENGSWVRAAYDADINLSRLDTSGGQRIEFVYDARKRIVELRRKIGDSMQYEYNEAGRPVMIRSGRQVVRVKYDADGEIADVDSASPRIALTLMHSHQELLSLAGALGRRNMPDLDGPDLEDERYTRRVMTATSRVARADAQLDHAEYLVEHTARRGDYGRQAAQIAREVFAAAIEDPSLLRFGPRAAGIYLAVLGKTRPAGLPREEFKALGDMQMWLRGAGARAPGASTALLQLAGSKLPLRDPDRWLQQSDLANPGYWRRYLYAELAPEHRRPFRAALVRANGDIVVGGEVGLSVRRRGHWSWYALDEARGQFVLNPGADVPAMNSRIFALAEDAKGALWIGTSNGLFCLSGAYDGEATRWSTASDGLPSPEITQLQALDSGVLVGTPAGARWFGVEGRKNGFAALADVPITSLLGGVAATPTGIFWIDEGLHDARRLTRFQAESAAFTGGSLVALAENQSWLIPTQDHPGSLPIDGAGAPMPLPDGNNIVAAKRRFGLHPLKIGRDQNATAFHTDRGVSIYHEHHVEPLTLPDADKDPPVFTLASADQTVVALTDKGVHVYERSEALHFNVGKRVYDVATIEDARLTLVAMGDRLEAVFHAAPEGGPKLVDRIAAQRVIADRKGGAITHDGLDIMRYDAKVGVGRILFRAAQTRPPAQFGGVHDLMVARDGTLWVAAGSSLFRYREGDAKAEEFSIHVDPVRFPLRSNVVSRVIETVDGRIWVIGSNEGHLRSDGVVLVGGVLELKGDRFARIDEMSDKTGWFIHRYTKLDDDTAIAGTTDGFVVHRSSGAFDPLRRKDDSYDRLAGDHPSLYMGTHGVRLDADTWLFGTANGMVAYWNGVWMYPERLNRQLPDQALVLYGARAVHGLDRDSAGRLYIGTDRGLTVVRDGGEGTAMLVDNGFASQAFADAARQQATREGQVLLPNLPADSELGRRVKRINQSLQEVERVEAKLRKEMRATLGGSNGKPDKPRPEEPGRKTATERLEGELSDKRAAHKRQLLELERREPQLHQLLALSPIDLEATREKLPPGVGIVQYVPTGKRLFIQLLTKDRSELREVRVSRDALYQQALSVASTLADIERAKRLFAAGQAEGKPAAVSLRGVVRGSLIPPGRLPVADQLAWMYEQLLRPIEREIAGLDYIYIVPVGPLTYLPFEALVRRQGARNEYAVERYAFGYLTSPHMWSAMLGASPSSESRTVVFADPDGGLPDARLEGQAIVDLGSGNLLRVGTEATYPALVEDAPRAGTLHLATHGVLDSRSPEKSYLLLAQNHRLSVVDAMALDLKKANMVVLSACESGLGMQGLEYATLARAFMLAGAETVVASLWKVPSPSTDRLMRAFYQSIATGESRIRALTAAKREFLKQATAAERDPHFWAGFILFGGN